MELKPPANPENNGTPQVPQDTLPPESITRVNVPMSEVRQNGDNPPATPPAEPQVPPKVPETPSTAPQGQFNGQQPKAPTDYRKKFGESTRENQILAGQMQELTRKLGEFTQEEIPTDDQMKVLYPEFEFASEIEKNVLKKTYMLDRKLNGVKETISSFANQNTATRKLQDYAYSNDRLKDREEEFIEFASKPDRIGVNPDILANAFLFEVKEETPEIVPEIPQHSIFERAGGQGAIPPEIGKKERTPEELQTLRKTDPKTYNEMIRTGQI